MAKLLTHRLPALLAVVAAASAFAAAPALASEGQPAPAPAPGLTPFKPFPKAPAKLVKRAKVGSKGVLKLRLAKPSRLRVTVSNRKGKRLRTIHVKAGKRNVSLRPTRHLRPGRYRVRIVTIDEKGVRSSPIERMVTVKPRAHR